MKEEFTKSEWIVYLPESDDFDDGVVVGLDSYNSNPYGHFCSHKIEIDSNDDEAIANAYLIAAAPEMYQVLKDITKLKIDDDCKINIKAVKRLLAKARGEYENQN